MLFGLRPQLATQTMAKHQNNTPFPHMYYAEFGRFWDSVWPRPLEMGAWHTP